MGFLEELRTVNNAIITLGDIDDSGKGKHFKSRFIQPGVAGYPGQFGNVLITKESLDKFIKTMVGVPVIINHKNLNENNADEERVGVVNSVWYDDKDGWYWCDGIIWDETAQNLITDKDWSVSCSYDVKTANDEGGSENNIKYDMEFLDGVFTHLALVNNPRYERANIVFNSKTEFVKDNKMDIENEKNEKGRWVTIKGTHVFIPEGKTVEDVIESKFKPYSEAIERDKKQLAYLKEKMDDPDNSPEKRETLVGQYQELKRRIKYYEEQDKKQKEKPKDEDKGKSEGDNLIKEIFTEDEIKTAIKDAEPNKMFSDKFFNKLIKELEKKEGSDYFDSYANAMDELEDIYTNYKNDIKKSAMDNLSKEDKLRLNKQQEKVDKIKKEYDKYLNQQEQLYNKGKTDSYEYEQIVDKTEELFKAYDKEGWKLHDLKQGFIKAYERKANNSKEREMEIIEKLKELIFSVENEKEQDMEAKNEKVDKRKLIDEVAGIMKSAGCDDEDIRTAIGKMEKLGYDDSEKSADNEKDDDKKDDEVKNCGKKVKNEDEEDEKEVKEVKEDVKEDVENKCKNSVDNSKTDYFAKLNEIYNSASSKRESKAEYMSRADREKAAEDYFAK